MIKHQPTNKLTGRNLLSKSCIGSHDNITPTLFLPGLLFDGTFSYNSHYGIHTIRAHAPKLPTLGMCSYCLSHRSTGRRQCQFPGLFFTTASITNIVIEPQ
ncbi:unnamed protein product [Periconia digitata]|uniref:Uncharacterized protein n=1 Tax=Periconia digitata TaxID=1303443 RepID=A0A9W4U4B8_9PLEO|nr:unnamed protein product [Periconia digitata]